MEGFSVTGVVDAGCTSLEHEMDALAGSDSLSA